uniref:Protein kinase domain-containing protein n=1 Tax=Timema genevievae TaxID=629358 RepID=A0A7R9JPV6_TIMGE|nr:unnamed protein product [Timema genevievae]
MAKRRRNDYEEVELALLCLAEGVLAMLNVRRMKDLQIWEDLHRVTMEIQALKRLSHHHISKLYQVIETETHYFLIMEYCAGGELFDHIVSKDRLGEGESRSFFRQIVSAVAYLHQQGYVHRDLKPENILLDRDQVLKLIDFGLCAQPSGGMGDHLFTSCGSPTYAAPELVLGQKYLGSEVDVWSMGVLLYALLCGCLPFDDKNITNLYKKILNGKYDEPTWLSIDTRKLIRSMLQVDPKKRISINELLCHPWLMLGYGDPVISDSLYEFQEREDECLLVMSKAYDITPDQMWRRLCRWRYDYDTATYQLLRTRKKRGAPLKLSSTTTKSLFRSRIFSDNVNIDIMHGNKHKPLYHCNTHSDLSSKENAHQDTPDFKKYCSRNDTYSVPKEKKQASIKRNETYSVPKENKQASIKRNETYSVPKENKQASIERNDTYTVPKENKQASIERNDTYTVPKENKQASIKINDTYTVPKENKQASIKINDTYTVPKKNKQASVKKNETYVMDNMNKRTSNQETLIPLKHTAFNETFILTNKKQHTFESSPTSYTECSSKTPVAGERDFSDTGSKFIRENENFQNFATPFAPTPRRRSHKRYRSPVLEDTSPVPSKMTPSQAKARACGQTESAPESARSGCFSPIGTPNSSRKVLDILQDGLHKMRHVLTPRKKIKTTSALQPTMLATKVSNVVLMFQT